MGYGGEGLAPSLLSGQSLERPMKRNDLSRPLVAFDQASTRTAAVELGLQLVRGGVSLLIPTRQSLKTLRSDPGALLELLLRW
jgi:hypothetical protein